LTDDCNLECLHCYNNKERTRYLDSEQFDYILNQVLEYINFRSAIPGGIIFCGGEPTLSPILLDCIRKSIDAGFKTASVLSNGTLFTNDFVKKLINARCTNVQIGIEGTKETHNAIRNGSWEKVLAAWKICKENGLYVYNQTTINSLNYKEIDEIIDICRGRVSCVRFVKHIPINDRIRMLTSAEWFEVIERFLHGFYYKGTLYNNFVSLLDLHWSIISGSRYTCQVKLKYPLVPIIDSNGDVYACRRGNISIGNIFRKSLVTVYEENEFLSRLYKEKLLNDHCSACYKLDICKGGCIGISLAAMGSIQAKDPHCIIDELSKMEQNKKTRTAHNYS